MNEGVLFIFYWGFIIFLWIAAGVKLNKVGGNNGLKYFFQNLGICFFVGVLSFFIIVFPVLDCTGWFCGLTEILIFFGLNALTTLIWPIVLLIISRKKFPEGKNQLNQEVLDDL